MTITPEIAVSRVEVLWTDGPDGNIQHLADHGVSCEEAEDVLDNPIATDQSHSSGLPIAFGYSRHGRKLAVVYEMIDEITVYPLTAYDLEE